MEDRRRGSSPMVRHVGAVPGKVLMDFTPRHVLAVTEGAPEGAFSAAVSALAMAGCAVELVCPDVQYAVAQKAAQALGARHLPFMADEALAYAERTKGSVDTLLLSSPEIAIPAGFGGVGARVIAIGDKPVDVAFISNAISSDNTTPGQAALLLCLPRAEFSGVVL